MDTRIASIGDDKLQSLNIDQLKSLYKTFDSTTLEQLPNLYHEHIHFKDPIHSLEGIKSLREYFAGFCNSQAQYTFEFTNELVNHSQAFLQWRMHYRHPKLKQGKPLTLEGITLIKFDSRIFYHEDFYDMGAMIYQHIPIVGWAIKKINNQLTSAKHE